MPRTRVTVPATTGDALANNKFRLIPENGALITLYGSCVTNGDTFGLAVNDRDIVQNGEELNIEIAADVVDTDRDLILLNEPVEGGQLYMPVTVTTEAQFELHIRYL